MGLRSKAKSALSQWGFFMPADSQLKVEDIHDLNTRHEQTIESEGRTEDYEIEAKILRQKLEEVSDELSRALNDKSQFRDEVNHLGDKLIKLEKQNDQLRKLVKFKSQEVEELQRRSDTTNCLCEKLKAEIQQKEQNFNQLFAAADTEVKRLRQSIASHETTIVNLNTDIAQLSNCKLDTHHDDRYFAGKYERCFEALNQWVLQTYGGNKAIVSGDTIDTLDNAVKSQCYRMIGKKWKETFLQRPIFVIQSFITILVEGHLLTPFLFGIKQHEYTALVGDGNTIAPEDLVNYRISTIKLVSGSSDFPGELDSKIQNVAENILSSFGPLLLESNHQKNAARLKRLKTILQTITDVTLEAKLEPSNFVFKLYQKGIPCESKWMTDIEESLKSRELNPTDAVVRFTIAPAIFRHAYNFEAALPILKAKILVLEKRQR